MSLPEVSVVLPAYNAADTLAQALDSLVAQSLETFEVVVVDDGSEDTTWELLTSAAQDDPRIRPVHMEHAGIVPALNLGLEKARGTLIARLDADDVCLPERLALQKGYLDQHPTIGLVGCKVAFGGDRQACAGYARYVDWTNTLLTPEAISLGRFRESPLPHPSVMFRASLVQEHGAYRDGDFPEDYELWLRFLDAGVAMAKVDQELVVWNDPPHRLSRNDPRYEVDRFYATKARYLARWLERHNPFHPDIVVMGAGRVSRKRADYLLGHGIRFAAYVDIDPRKVGKVVHGRPVIHRDELQGPGEQFAVSFVASHGAGSDISRFLGSRGWTPGRDFLLAA